MNCRLLMRIFSNALDISMIHSMRLLMPLPCIYWGKSLRSMKLPTDSSFIAQSFAPIVIFSLTHIHRSVKWRSYGARLSEISAAVCRQWILCV